MRLRRPALVLVVAAAALITALPANAKDDVRATLTSPVPLDAPAGSLVTIAWTLFSVDEKGHPRPFGANGAFVRLLGHSGAASEEGVAALGAHLTGEYETTVLVPEGGIRDIELGLQGWVSDPNGTRRSDVIFPIANDPIPDPAPLGSPGPNVAHGTADGAPSWLLAVVGGLAFVCALGGAVLIPREAPPPDGRSSQTQDYVARIEERLI
jgi:hypothetical protein